MLSTNQISMSQSTKYQRFTLAATRGWDQRRWSSYAQNVLRKRGYPAASHGFVTSTLSRRHTMYFTMPNVFVKTAFQTVQAYTQETKSTSCSRLIGRNLNGPPVYALRWIANLTTAIVFIHRDQNAYAKKTTKSFWEVPEIKKTQKRRICAMLDLILPDIQIW
jgi:hypothetical protein